MAHNAHLTSNCVKGAISKKWIDRKWKEILNLIIVSTNLNTYNKNKTTLNLAINQFRIIIKFIASVFAFAIIVVLYNY